MTTYRCPRTGRALERRDGYYQSLDGNTRYPIEHGIPNFRLTPPSSVADEEALARMCATAEAEGWRAAIQAHRPELLAYVDDPSRAMFLDLIDLAPDKIALEIGPGLGQILVPLAQRVKKAYALELSPGQARFVAERCRQAGRENVEVAAGNDDLLLPYPDGMFDIVVLNHVLEWVRTPGEDVTDEAQKLVISEIRRVLAPGGQMYLSTKNRYGLRLLLGGADENARELRFGNALPRSIANALARKRSGGILGRLHSYPHLERLIRDAGFQSLQSYWAAPDGRYPKHYVSTEPEAIREARRASRVPQGTTRSTRLLMPLVPAKYVKYVAPGLTFVARSTGVART